MHLNVWMTHTAPTRSVQGTNVPTMLKWVLEVDQTNGQTDRPGARKNSVQSQSFSAIKVASGESKLAAFQLQLLCVTVTDSVASVLVGLTGCCKGVHSSNIVLNDSNFPFKFNNNHQQEFLKQFKEFQDFKPQSGG